MQAERRSFGRLQLFALSALFCASALSAEPTGPLPEPLTLEYALSLAGSTQPAVAKARAELAERRANYLLADSITATRVSLEGRLRWIEPSPLATDQSHNDSQGSLFIRKNLYDFGRSSALLAAADSATTAGEQLYASAVDQQRLSIMARFFDVLLADLTAAKDEEDMAVAYVTYDRLRKRHDLGQVSDIDLARADAEYQAVRKRRAQSEAEQRASRARLALALGRTEELPSWLAEPDLAYAKAKPPEYEALVAKASTDNPAIKARRADLQAAQQRVDAARAGSHPFLDGELEAAGYAREMGSHDKWRASVVLNVPLYSGGAVSAAVAKAIAGRDRAEAELAATEQQVREAILEVWLALQTLDVARQQISVLQDYRDLYLDRSRALYDMEVKTDLGDAMVRLSEAQLEAAHNRYQRALSWARLRALTGGLPAGGLPGKSAGGFQ